jgi:hypothetical protein
LLYIEITIDAASTDEMITSAGILHAINRFASCFSSSPSGASRRPPPPAAPVPAPPPAAPVPAPAALVVPAALPTAAAAAAAPVLAVRLVVLLLLLDHVDDLVGHAEVFDLPPTLVSASCVRAEEGGRGRTLLPRT